jgi:KamA family protein
MPRIQYLTHLDRIAQLGAAERERLELVSERFVFRTNDYYQSLIDWSDPDDPIRKIVMPDAAELDEWGRLDASDEAGYTKVPGLEHKYEFTALLLVNDVCGGYCRFCFRKRLFMEDNDEVVRDVGRGLEYLREHVEINNVLLTGGDPLLMSTAKLEKVIAALRAIDHVQIIRIGSKMPAFNPFRILDDPSLTDMLSRYSTADKRIYVMAHFNHPRELTEPATQSLDRLLRAGVVTVNQTPLLRGVNDNPAVLGDLFNRLSYVGVPPYYVFQCRPTLGNRQFAIPLEEAFEIFEQARMRCSGLAKRARFVMSHATGKIEILGMNENSIYMRYHRAADFDRKARFMVLRRNPRAYWFDDYEEIEADYAITNPFRCYGPE